MSALLRHGQHRLAQLAPSALLVSLLVSVWSVAASAAPPSAQDRESFAQASAALQAGEPSRAVELLERLADRGVQHPDVAYNRGVAYLERADSALSRPGDWGQAAAAFAEASALAPNDAAAEAGLEEARLRIARRRARASETGAVDTEPLAQRALGLLSQPILFGAAALGSLLVTLGIVGGGIAAWQARRSNWQLAARIVLGVGLAIALPAAGLEWARARWLAMSTPAIVVSERASLLDAAGRPLPHSPALAEGQGVHVLESNGRLARIVTSGEDAWVPSASLRRLPVAR